MVSDVHDHRSEACAVRVCWCSNVSCAVHYGAHVARQLRVRTTAYAYAIQPGRCNDSVFVASSACDVRGASINELRPPANGAANDVRGALIHDICVACGCSTHSNTCNRSLFGASVDGIGQLHFVKVHYGTLG